MSFAERLREELAHVPWQQQAGGHPTAGAPGQSGSPSALGAAGLAEVATALRVGGALRLGHGVAGVVLTTGIGAVARRLHAGVAALTGQRAEVEVHRAQGLSTRSRYRLVWRPGPDALVQLGLLDEDGRPVEGLRPAIVGRQPAAALRGAMMVAGSVSDPGRPAHLEIAAPGERSAQDLVGLLRAVGAPSARASAHGDAWRVVVKSGGHIATVLARVGAHTAFLHYDQGRLRRELRAEANRVANADGANVQRSVTASARQLSAVEAALRRGDLERLAPELAEVALARVANPQASLGELGALLDPPVGKVTVYRRLARLEDFARNTAPTDEASADPPLRPPQP